MIYAALKRLLRCLVRPFAETARRLGVPVPERLFRHLHFNGPFNVRLPNKCEVRLMSTGSRVENELYWRGWRGHEPETMVWWVNFAAEGGDILDVGANTATFAFIARALSPKGAVVAFEPVSRIAVLARENVAISGLEVEIVEAAVADKVGRMVIHDPGGSNAYSASLIPGFIDGKTSQHEVDVTTIDSFCQARGLKPRLIKIDVEGAEGFAIIGAALTIEEYRPRIICEWLGSQKNNEQAVRILEDLGYTAFDLATLKSTNLRLSCNYQARNVLLLHGDEVPSLFGSWIGSDR
jgi:FkbM family methyltransferase